VKSIRMLRDKQITLAKGQEIMYLDPSGEEDVEITLPPIEAEEGHKGLYILLPFVYPIEEK